MSEITARRSPRPNFYGFYVVYLKMRGRRTRFAVPQPTRRLKIPSEYTPETKIVPPASAVAPWIEEIIRLWDDREYYQTRRQKGLERAKIWEPKWLAFEYDKCFRSLVTEQKRTIL